MIETESKPVKILYDDGDGTRALRGVIESETTDGLFFVVVRPRGDKVWVAKSAVKAITPISEEP